MNENLLAKNLLLSDNFWTLNKTVVKELGIEATIVLTVFAEAESLLADEKGWFYQTIDTIEEMTTLTRHKQTQAIKKLEESGLIEQINKGQPMKRYFRINYKILSNIFKKDSHPSMSKIDKLVCKGSTNSYVNNSHTSMLKTDKLICKKSATSKESTYKESINKESIKNISKEPECEITLQLKDNSKYSLDDDYYNSLINTYGKQVTDVELKKMDIWLQSNPGRRKTKLGMKRFIANWINSNHKVEETNNIKTASKEVEEKVYTPEEEKAIRDRIARQREKYAS